MVKHNKMVIPFLEGFQSVINLGQEKWLTDVPPTQQCASFSAGHSFRREFLSTRTKKLSHLSHRASTVQAPCTASLHSITQLSPLWDRWMSSLWFYWIGLHYVVVSSWDGCRALWQHCATKHIFQDQETVRRFVPPKDPNEIPQGWRRPRLECRTAWIPTQPM